MIAEYRQPLPAARRRSARACRSAAAFTLIELMVSVALALILLLGVNQVFKITTDTIGTVEALGSVVRTDRAIQQIFSDDTRAAVANQPCIIIDSQPIFAFRNRADEAADRDASASTWDPTQSGTEQPVDTFTYGGRVHRADLFSFFASDLFRRQTGNDGNYASSTTSNEAWISYGHLRIYNQNAGGLGEYKMSAGPNSRGSYPYPGDVPVSNNPNNYYASTWVLGRVQMLLAENPVGEAFVRRAAPVTPDGRMAPLSNGSTISANGTTMSTSTPDGTPWIIQHHRLDLADTSITQMRGYAGARQTMFQTAANPYDVNTWNLMAYRFAANPYVTRPAEARKMAQAAAVFVNGCSQFMVDFAGDFVSQNEDGSVIAPTIAGAPFPKDGKIDFIAERVATGPDRYTKTTRWYGMPRDTGSSVLGSFAGRPDGIINPAFDVVPVRDVRGVRSPFEKQIPNAQNPYAATSLSEYFCGFGPVEVSAGDLPKMVRITLTIDDAAGRLADGQTYEYVLKMGL